MEVRTNVNSLFGQFTSAVNTGVITWTGANTNAAISDFVMRGKHGLQQQIVASNKAINAIGMGAEFLTAKRADLVEILDKLYAKFNTIYTEEVKRGLTLKETKENTVNVVNKELDRLMRLHHEKFPDELCKKVIRKLVG